MESSYLYSRVRSAVSYNADFIAAFSPNVICDLINQIENICDTSIEKLDIENMKNLKKLARMALPGPWLAKYKDIKLSDFIRTKYKLKDLMAKKFEDMNYKAESINTNYPGLIKNETGKLVLVELPQPQWIFTMKFITAASPIVILNMISILENIQEISDHSINKN